MKKVLLTTSISATLICCATFTIASEKNLDETWTKGMRQEMRRSCAAEMQAVGLKSQQAWELCDCITANAEDEFGLSGFGYIAASDERYMPEIEKRMDEAISPCFD